MPFYIWKEWAHWNSFDMYFIHARILFFSFLNYPHGTLLGAGAEAEGLMVGLIHWLLKWRATFLSIAPPCGHKWETFHDQFSHSTRNYDPGKISCVASLHFYSCTITVILGRVIFDQLPQDVQASLGLSEDGLTLQNATENHFPNPGIEPRSPALQVDSLPSEPPAKLILQKGYE